MRKHRPFVENLPNGSNRPLPLRLVGRSAEGHGIGSTLVAILLATAKLRVQLTVSTGNSRAIRLYRSFGFQFEGTAAKPFAAGE